MQPVINWLHFPFAKWILNGFAMVTANRMNSNERMGLHYASPQISSIF